MTRRLAAALMVALLAGCATPSERITAKLVELGVPRPQARCMGGRLGVRLTTTQLQRLARVASADRAAIGRMSLRDILRQVDTANDPELVAELVRAGIDCAI